MSLLVSTEKTMVFVPLISAFRPAPASNIGAVTALLIFSEPTLPPPLRTPNERPPRSCLRLTASVSSVPSARLMIWRSWPPPTETAPQVWPFRSTALNGAGVAMVNPARSAVLEEPSATAPSAETTLALCPTMTASDAVVSVAPSAEPMTTLLLRPSIVRLSPMITLDSPFFTLFSEPMTVTWLTFSPVFL